MLDNTIQPQLYGNVTHYGHDLEGTKQLRLCMQDNMCLFACAVACVHLFVCLSVWSYAAHVRLNAETLQPSAFENPRLYAPHQRYELLCFPYYSSLSSAYEVIEHAPLSFAFTLLCFQCPSMHQCQPPSPQASDL